MKLDGWMEEWMNEWRGWIKRQDEPSIPLCLLTSLVSSIFYHSFRFSSLSLRLCLILFFLSCPRLTTPNYLTFLSHFAVFPIKLAASSSSFTCLFIPLTPCFSFHPSFTTPLFCLPLPSSTILFYPHSLLLSSSFCLLSIPHSSLRPHSF